MIEKYYIINNAEQYFIVIKCTELQLNNCFEYGIKNSLTYENAINLFKLSEWLIKHQIKHILILGKINNILFRWIVDKDINKLNREANKNCLLIDKHDFEKVLLLNKNERIKLFW